MSIESVVHQRVHQRLPITLAAICVCALSGTIGCRRQPTPTTPAPPQRPRPRLQTHQPQPPSPWRDVTEEAGIRWRHSFGDTQFSNLVEAVGGGAVFFDYDGDGRLDLYLTTGKYAPPVSKGERPPAAARNALYHNVGGGRFEEVTDRAGVACDHLFSMGAAAGDYDGDGDADLYVCNFGGGVLFRNDGNGRFTDVTGTAGVGDEKGCAISSVWFDFDRDGRLDLYVANYIEFDPEYNLYYAPDGFPGPLSYAGQPDRLYRNLGDGRFQDVSSSVGLNRHRGRAMSACTLDYDEDGYQDIYVANDAMQNYLLRNEAGKRFVESAQETGVGFNSVGDAASSMSVDFADCDGDGRLDLWVSDSSICSLFVNDGGGVFTDATIERGIAEASGQFVSWGSFFFDYDNDGDLDLFKVNADLSRLFGQEDQLFENQSDGRYVDVSDQMGPYFDQELLGRGAAWGDYDDDGDLDVIIVNLNGAAVLLRNELSNGNHWLGVRLVGRRSPTDAFGARVTVWCGQRSWTAVKHSASGYLSQSDPRLHFGLGKEERVDSIEVRWPSGARQTAPGTEVDRVVTIEEPTD